jgi:hypothetical protein
VAQKSAIVIGVPKQQQLDDHNPDQVNPKDDPRSSFHRFVVN